MTLLFVDSFDHYDTTEFQEKGYTTNAGTIKHKISIGEGRRGTNCLKSNVGLGEFSLVLQHAIEDSDTLVIGCALNINDFHGQIQIEINDAIGNSLLKLQSTPAGELQIISGGQTATTAASIYVPNTYSHYEIKYTKGSGSDGFAELRKNGIVLLTITNSTETAQASEFELLETFVLQSFSKLDDLYVLNGLGATNNDYLGDVRVDAHFASADGATIDFLGNTGADNYTHVDDKPFPDGDSTYTQAGTIDNLDLHEMDTASLGTIIYGVQPVVLNRKTDAGIITAELITQKPGGAGEKSSGTGTVSDDYAYHYYMLENDPDDTTTWTDAKINATEFGYKINNIVT